MKKHRVNVLLVASVLLSLGAQVGAAQSGVIAFFDTCDNRPYVMRGDGTGRIRLADAYATPWDISRGGWPMTVVTHELFAVEVSDIAGQLEVGPLVSLEPEGGVGWTETPAISLVVDRIAYMTPGSTSFYPMTIWVADLVRSSSGRIAAATNHRVLARWDEIGSPSDLVEGPVQSGLGGIAFSPDGRSLLVEVYGDLWLLHLAGDGSLLAKQRVTQTRERVEWGGAFSPDGRKLAFTAFDLKLSTKVPSKGTYTSDPAKLYVLDLDSGVAAVPLLNRNNMGEAQNSSLGFREPSWSPDGTYIVFSARGGKSNKPPCGSGNTDIFIIRSDGTGQATSLTRTDTTSKEQWPQWGW